METINDIIYELNGNPKTKALAKRIELARINDEQRWRKDIADTRRLTAERMMDNIELTEKNRCDNCISRGNLITNEKHSPEPWGYDERMKAAHNRIEADRIEEAVKRDCEYPKAQSLDADKLTGKTISGLATDLRQIAKYHYARGNIVQGQFARVMADRIEAAHKREMDEAAKVIAELAEGICAHCDMQSDCAEGEDGMSTACNAMYAVKEFIEKHEIKEEDNGLPL